MDNGSSWSRHSFSQQRFAQLQPLSMHDLTSHQAMCRLLRAWLATIVDCNQARCAWLYILYGL